MQCEQCKFAVWDLTKSGRKSPTGEGKCSWEKTFRIAASLPYDMRKIGPTYKGGHICRKYGYEFPALKCDVFQPIEQKE